MNNYVIVSDATLDLPNDIVDKLDIKVIPMVFDLDNITYTHYPDEREIKIEDFYFQLKNGASSVSSQISPFTYQEFFEKFLKEGLDIIYIAFSSGLSGTYNSANIIIDELRESYPERTIYSVDSLCASIGEGLLVYHAAQLKKQGYSLDELKAWIEENRTRVRHWFTVKDLFHLRRGGRISGIEAVVGTALKIRPALSVDKEGKLVVKSKVRGSKKELEFMCNILQEEGINIEEQTVIIAHGDNLNQAHELETLLREKHLVKDVIISKIGPIIGTHTGPGMLALTFLGIKSE